jgi:putative DNA primase/helicase
MDAPIKTPTQSAPSDAPARSIVNPRSAETSNPRQSRPEEKRSREEPLIMGRLQAFGRAPYQFRAEESPSFFVRILTQRGERTLWGKDFERALKEAVSKPQQGDQVGARRVGREAVTIVSKERDAEGRVLRQTEMVAHRQRWVLEKVQFFAERSKMAQRVRDAQADAREAVKTHPELLSSFLSLRGAQELAERRIADPKDRERFMGLVREAMAGSIRRGEPLPAVRLKTAKTVEPARSPPSREPDLEPTR